jgi:hypothetical protein
MIDICEIVFLTLLAQAERMGVAALRRGFVPRCETVGSRVSILLGPRVGTDTWTAD